MGTLISSSAAGREVATAEAAGKRERILTSVRPLLFGFLVACGVLLLLQIEASASDQWSPPGESSLSLSSSPTPKPEPASKIAALPITESFETVPPWSSSYNAVWGGSAVFSAEPGGESGNYLQAYRDNGGSSARVQVFSVPSDTGIVISVFMRCPESVVTYWMETGFRLGTYTAQDFDQNAGSWTLVKKLSSVAPNQNGNGDTWVQYSSYVYTGAQTAISIGYKLGRLETCSVGSLAVGWDSLEIVEGGPLPTPTPEITPTPTPTARYFPFPIPQVEGAFRLASWNIEYLGTRSPPRTQEQLNDLAARMLTIDAAVFALQEIQSYPTLEYVRSQMGASWVFFESSTENTLLYNEQKVEALSLNVLASLSEPPYTTYPHIARRRPITGVFRRINGSGETFRVIGIHCDAFDEQVRETTGNWLRMKIIEYLNDPLEPQTIFLIGDFNGGFPCPPHAQVLDGGFLDFLPKENGDDTFVSGSSIDHCDVTAAAAAMLSRQSAYVVRPEHFGETPSEFDANYSDHFPIFVEVEAPEPATSIPFDYWQYK